MKVSPLGMTSYVWKEVLPQNLQKNSKKMCVCIKAENYCNFLFYQHNDRKIVAENGSEKIMNGYATEKTNCMQFSCPNVCIIYLPTLMTETSSI